MHASDALAEADRLMTVCNACRYCEGLCAVFPAMEMRRSFADADLRHLANLCHGCGACLADCQFAPPHEFAVDVPRALARVRVESWRYWAWPRGAANGFDDRNGARIAVAAVLSVALLFLGFTWWHGSQTLFAVHDGPGAFYRLMPHGLMVAIFGAAFVYACVALAMGWRACRRDLPSIDLGGAEWWRALRDAGSLRYLDGGGVGCSADEDRAGDRRRAFHHLAFYGFLLCFASTVVATFHHYALGRPAPYAWHDLPVVLGTIGGVGLVIGPAGLLATRRRDGDAPRARMDTAFTAMLLLTGATGLALLALRATPAMGALLALHLGVVFGFFVTLPYGKFVHGLYRFAALLRHAAERRAGVTARAAPRGGSAPAATAGSRSPGADRS